MALNKSFLLSIFLTILTVELSAQRKYLQLKVVGEKQMPSGVHDPQKWYDDSLDVVLELNDFYLHLHRKSYLGASIDEIKWVKDSVVATIYIGQQYKWTRLSFGALEKNFIQSLTYKEKYFRNKNLKVNEVTRLEKSIIKYAENNGYPFASVKLDSISFEDEGIEATLNYFPGPKILFDTVQITGTSEVSKQFITRYIRIKEGEPFSQKKMEDAGFLLKNIPALKLKSPPQAVFYNNKSVVQLQLDQRKNNQFYGIIGFLPNEGNEGKLLVTGEVNLMLTNVFGSAKVIKAEWKKLKALSQYLDMAYEHPNFLGTNLDVLLSLNLLKEDTTFINVERIFGLTYNLGKKGSLRVITRYKTGRLLSTSQYSVTNLPDYLDTDFWSYGINYTQNRLDDIFQPRKGVKFGVEAGMGNKKIKKNTGLDEGLYANTKSNTLQINIEGNFEHYHKVGKQTVLAHKIRGGTIQNENILLNEAFRIGGYQTLRGFAENEFFATGYALSNLEFRVFTDETSYAFLLYDQAYLVRDVLGEVREDFPLGLGAGINMLTPAGYLNFIYSVGTAKNQPISFNRSKIHFGLVSIF